MQVSALERRSTRATSSALLGAVRVLAAMTGRTEEAEALYRATYDARKKKLGEDHPDTLSSAGNLAVLLAQVREDALEVQPVVDAHRGLVQLALLLA